MDCVVGIDVGGTAIKAALLDADAKPVAERRVATVAGDVDAVVTQLLAVVEELSNVAEHKPAGVGVVVPGVVDEDRGMVVLGGNLGWHGVHLRALLESRISLPLAVGHDVRAGALAEGTLGAARGTDDYLFLPLGTGIAAGIVIGGQPLVRGGLAGELGHVVVEPGGRACGCGQRGCLETVASAAAIAARYDEATPGQGFVPAKEVLSRAGCGDALAAEIVDRAVAALADVLATYVTLLAPDAIVVGGGLALAGDRLLAGLAAALGERLSFQYPPHVRAAALGDLAGAIGAGLLAWRVPETAGVAR
ncbi:MAG: ROK family protein [Solirubrobacterales bacterium]|nr:ROK family protein [Solirubrobacterales bacterium]